MAFGNSRVEGEMGVLTGGVVEGEPWRQQTARAEAEAACVSCDGARGTGAGPVLPPAALAR